MARKWPVCCTSAPSSRLLYAGDQCENTTEGRARALPVARFGPADCSDGYKPGPSGCDVEIQLGKDGVSAADILQTRYENHVGDKCLFGTADLRMMMLLNTYQSSCPVGLDSVFYRIPQDETSGEYAPPQAYVMYGPYMPNEPVRPAEPCNNIVFNAKEHIVEVPKNTYASKISPSGADVYSLWNLKRSAGRSEALEALITARKVVNAGRTYADQHGNRCLDITADELNGAIPDTMRSLGDVYVAMGEGTYRRYMEDKAKIRSPIPDAPCILPGLDCKVVVDGTIDDLTPETIYAFNKECGVHLIQGPISVVMRADDSATIRDFFEYTIVDKHLEKNGGILTSGHTALRIEAKK